jgi:cardiolipin synthase A/B
VAAPQTLKPARTARPRPADRVVIAIDERRTTVLEALAAARRRVGLSLFRCTDEAVFSALARAVRRGVKVDAIVSLRSKGSKQDQRRLRDALSRRGVTVHPYMDPVVKYHAKYLVVDDGPAIVTSLNFTKKCFSRTVDALVVTHDAAVVDGLWRLMRADWKGSALPDGLPARLIVGPERARKQIAALIGQARRRLTLLDAKLTDPAMRRLLAARRRQGLEVRLMTDKQLHGLKAHGKILVIDNRLAMVGSIALRTLSLESRREVALVVEDRAAVKALLSALDGMAGAGGGRSGRG